MASGCLEETGLLGILPWLGIKTGVFVLTLLREQQGINVPLFILLNLSMAFTTLSHDILLERQDEPGARDTMLLWFHADFRRWF